jgi:hypothetical protein
MHAQQAAQEGGRRTQVCAACEALLHTRRHMFGGFNSNAAETHCLFSTQRE